MAKTYAGILNQYKFKYLTVFSARFEKKDENDQKLNKIELNLNINSNQSLTQSDID